MPVVNLNGLKQITPRLSQRKTDTISVAVPAGKIFKIEFTPDGEEIATGTVPTGKVWDIDVTVAIVERDA